MADDSGASSPFHAYMQVKFGSANTPVEGSCSEKNHLKWSVLTSYGFTVSQKIDSIPTTGGPQNVGKAEFSDVKITKPFDAASPTLFQLCALCVGDCDVTIDVWGHLGNVKTNQRLLKISLTDAAIVKYDHQASDSGGAVNYPWGLTETLEFNYTTLIERWYNNEGNSIDKGWDVKTHKKKDA